MFANNVIFYLILGQTAFTLATHAKADEVAILLAESLLKQMEHAKEQDPSKVIVS